MTPAAYLPVVGQSDGLRLVKREADDWSVVFEGYTLIFCSSRTRPRSLVDCEPSHVPTTVNESDFGDEYAIASLAKRYQFSTRFDITPADV